MIGLLADLVVLIIAIQHFAFMALEMFLWDKPIGLQVFKQSREQATASKLVASNLGLYNGFLAAGLVWGLTPSVFANDIRSFFLCCIIVAGAYGAFSTGQKMIAYVQSAPAAFALLLVLLS